MRELVSVQDYQALAEIVMKLVKPSTFVAEQETVHMGTQTISTSEGSIAGIAMSKSSVETVKK